MKSDFKDPTAIKGQRPADMPKNGKNSPWDFRAPQYDERSSSFVNAGTHYGVGHRNPVGHEGNAKQFVETLPQGRAKTMRDDVKG